MANKYVSIYGNAGNDGTGPTHDKAWRLIDTSIDAIDDGDVLYVGPGIYRECISLADTPAAERIVRGDPMNTQGFTDGSDVLVPPNHCVITNMLTDDVTAATNTTTLLLNGNDHITLENLWVESFSTACALDIAAGTEYITIRNCHIFGGVPPLRIQVAASTNSHCTVDRCNIVSPLNNAVNIYCAKCGTADYDCGVLISNCNVMSVQYGFHFLTSLSGTNFGAGIKVLNCDIFAYQGVRSHSNYNVAITPKMQVSNCVIHALYGFIDDGGSTDVITESYNLIFAGTPRIAVDVGTGTIEYGSDVFARSLRFDYGQSQMFGFLPKSYMAPWSTCRAVGFGNESTPPTVDILNRVRPSGSGVAAASVLNSVGAYELHDFGVKETTVKDAGDASIKLTGPGDHDIRVPVDATATTISIKGRMDSATYGGANYPQAILLDAADIGVSTETEVMSAAYAPGGAHEDEWETLTFTQFTPTLKGWVVIRLTNRGSGADDICYFDTLAVT